MKRLFLALLISFMVFSMGASAQIIDEAPQDALYEDADFLDKQPVPYPAIRKADVMWSKRIWREVDFRQKFNQKFYFPTETQANWKSFMVVVLDDLKKAKLLPTIFRILMNCWFPFSSKYVALTASL